MLSVQGLSNICYTTNFNFKTPLTIICTKLQCVTLWSMLIMIIIFAKLRRIKKPLTIPYAISSLKIKHDSWFFFLYCRVPTPSIPNPSLGVPYLKEAFIIGIVAFTQSVSMAKILARKNNYTIDPNQVCIMLIHAQVRFWFFDRCWEKKRDLTQSYDESPIPTENSTTNWKHKNATKIFDYTTIADRLRTVSWSYNSHPTVVVKPVNRYPTFPLTATAVQSKFVNNPSYRDWVLNLNSVSICDCFNGKSRCFSNYKIFNKKSRCPSQWFGNSWFCFVRLKCYYAFFLVCCGCDTSYTVSVHFQCQASIYTLSLGRGHSLRVRLAKQETLTPPRHLVSPLVCRGPWMSTVVLYCWCHSDKGSVLSYLTLMLTFSWIYIYFTNFV